MNSNSINNTKSSSSTGQYQLKRNGTNNDHAVAPIKKWIPIVPSTTPKYESLFDPRIQEKVTLAYLLNNPEFQQINHAPIRPDDIRGSTVFELDGGVKPLSRFHPYNIEKEVNREFFETEEDTRATVTDDTILVSKITKEVQEEIRTNQASVYMARVGMSPRTIRLKPFKSNCFSDNQDPFEICLNEHPSPMKSQTTLQSQREVISKKIPTEKVIRGSIETGFGPWSKFRNDVRDSGDFKLSFSARSYKTLMRSKDKANKSSFGIEIDAHAAARAKVFDIQKKNKFISTPIHPHEKLQRTDVLKALMVKNSLLHGWRAKDPIELDSTVESLMNNELHAALSRGDTNAKINNLKWKRKMLQGKKWIYEGDGADLTDESFEWEDVIVSKRKRITSKIKKKLQVEFASNFLIPAAVLKSAKIKERLIRKFILQQHQLSINQINVAKTQDFNQLNCLAETNIKIPETQESNLPVEIVKKSNCFLTEIDDTEVSESCSVTPNENGNDENNKNGIVINHPLSPPIPASSSKEIFRFSLSKPQISKSSDILNLLLMQRVSSTLDNPVAFCPDHLNSAHSSNFPGIVPSTKRKEVIPNILLGRSLSPLQYDLDILMNEEDKFEDVDCSASINPSHDCLKTTTALPENDNTSIASNLLFQQRSRDDDASEKGADHIDFIPYRSSKRCRISSSKRGASKYQNNSLKADKTSELKNSYFSFDTENTSGSSRKAVSFHDKKKKLVLKSENDEIKHEPKTVKNNEQRFSMTHRSSAFSNFSLFSLHSPSSSQQHSIHNESVNANQISSPGHKPQLEQLSSSQQLLSSESRIYLSKKHTQVSSPLTPSVTKSHQSSQSPRASIRRIHHSKLNSLCNPSAHSTSAIASHARRLESFLQLSPARLPIVLYDHIVNAIGELISNRSMEDGVAQAYIDDPTFVAYMELANSALELPSLVTQDKNAERKRRIKRLRFNNSITPHSVSKLCQNPFSVVTLSDQEMTMEAFKAFSKRSVTIPPPFLRARERKDICLAKRISKESALWLRKRPLNNYPISITRKLMEQRIPEILVIEYASVERVKHETDNNKDDSMNPIYQWNRKKYFKVLDKSHMQNKKKLNNSMYGLNIVLNHGLRGESQWLKEEIIEDAQRITLKNSHAGKFVRTATNREILEETWKQEDLMQSVVEHACLLRPLSSPGSHEIFLPPSLIWNEKSTKSSRPFQQPISDVIASCANSCTSPSKTLLSLPRIATRHINNVRENHHSLLSSNSGKLLSSCEPLMKKEELKHDESSIKFPFGSPRSPGSSPRTRCEFKLTECSSHLTNKILHTEAVRKPSEKEIKDSETQKRQMELRKETQSWRMKAPSAANSQSFVDKKSPPWLHERLNLNNESEFMDKVGNLSRMIEKFGYH